MQKSNIKYGTIVTYLIILLFILLPYIWFGDRLFIGGDDSRLFYVYPNEWLKQFGLSSWLNFSGLGGNNPQGFITPLLLFLSIFEFIGLPGYIIQNSIFSFILILTFIYSVKFLLLIVGEEYKNEAMLCSLFYLLSPILYANQFQVFLYSIWLVPLIPIILYYGIRYIKGGYFGDIIKLMLACVLLSLALFSIPWLLGFLLPGIFVFIYLLVINWRIIYIKRIFVIIIVSLLSQSFWLIPFGMNLFDSDGYLKATVLSEETGNTFKPIVEATSFGNTIIYPITNLSHYNLMVNFNNPIKKVYDTYYLKFLFISFIYITVILVSFLLMYREKLKTNKQQVFLGVFISYIIVLGVFTVNIPGFKEVFLNLGSIPGFVMFRNFFDKFALGYILFFAILLFLALSNLKDVIPKKYYLGIFGILILTIIINSFPFLKGDLFHLPLWTTNQIYTNIKIPSEYTEFLSKVSEKTLKNERIMIIPYGISIYSYIQDPKTNEMYIGRSPIELFTGIKDVSGRFSFGKFASKFEDALLATKYDQINDFLINRGISYFFFYPNLPKELLNSYLFDSKLLNAQNDDFRKHLFGEKLITSKYGNYELYKLKSNGRNGIINMNGGQVNLSKVFNTQYTLDIKSLGNMKELIYRENFSSGWKLYLEPYFPLNCASGATTYTGTSIPEKIGTGMYTIKSMDTFEKIARNNTGVTIDDIIELNPNVKRDMLQIGQKIVIPVMNSTSFSQGRNDTYRVTECSSDTTFYAGGEISKLWEKPIFDDTHRLIYAYANAWTIDPEYIKANYSKEYYHENPDGSIDIRVTLYFRPQSYFYLGIIVSATTCIVLIGYLIYAWWGSRRRHNRIPISSSHQI